MKNSESNIIAVLNQNRIEDENLIDDKLKILFQFNNKLEKTQEADVTSFYVC